MLLKGCANSGVGPTAAMQFSSIFLGELVGYWLVGLYSHTNFWDNDTGMSNVYLQLGKGKEATPFLELELTSKRNFTSSPRYTHARTFELLSVT